MTFAEIVEYRDKKLVAIKRILRTCNLLRSRPMSYHTVTKSQVTNRIFKLTPVHDSVISQTHWFQWKFCFILLLSLYWTQLSDHMGFRYDVITFCTTSGGSKGRRERRAPRDPNSFNFMQFLGKFGKIVCWCPAGELAPPPRGNPGSTTESTSFWLSLYICTTLENVDLFNIIVADSKFPKAFWVGFKNDAKTGQGEFRILHTGWCFSPKFVKETNLFTGIGMVNVEAGVFLLLLVCFWNIDFHQTKVATINLFVEYWID